MKRILLVDDEKSIAFAVRHYFMQQGYVVDCASTSEEALECLAAQHYAVAILDVELRGSGTVDGLHLAQFIRRHAPATAIIILTALQTAETENRAREAGVHSFMQKPAPLAQLADIASGLIRDRVAASH